MVSKSAYKYNPNTFGNSPIYVKVPLITLFNLALIFINPTSIILKVSKNM